MEITVLLENETQDKQVKAKHGLSILVKTMGKKILFDTGPDGTFIQNARKMNVQLDNVDSIVISHGHIDHIGGLKYFPKENNLSNVIVSDGIFDNHSIKIVPFYKNVGADKSDYTNINDKITKVSSSYKLYKNVYILMCKEIKESDRSLVSSNNLFEGNPRKLDVFNHELVMVVQERDELYVFTGCSHSGILNIVNLVESNFDKPIKAVIGGFHLIGLPYLNTLNTTKENVEQLANQLLSKKVETYYTCHCTGPKAYRIMKTFMKDRLDTIRTGSRLKF